MNKLTIALASAASLAIVACAEEPAENVAYEDAATADQMANAEAETGTVVEVA
ncbi:MAG TPA: beta-Ig-H3/fasciclin, partial [Erythrobacter sp.]|nr:beta-Ig-H3/fasciclin [Erythrobacter sp.]